MSELEVRLLGPVEVLLDGEPVALGGPKQKAVAALLAAEVGRVVSSDRLIEAVWGDDAANRTTQHLQTYAGNLRRVIDKPLGRTVIATRAPGYVLDLDPDAVDLHRFTQLATEARDRMGEGRDQDALALFRRAEELWRGDALADLQFEPVADDIDLTAVDEARLSVVEDRIECQLRLGQHDQLTGELDALTAATPTRERRWGQLMLALYRSQRQADALEAFNRARAHLVEGLGLEPSVELRDLERRILEQDPALDVTAAPSRTAAVEGPSEPAGRPLAGPWTALQSDAGLLLVEATGGSVFVRSIAANGDERTVGRARLGGRIDALTASSDGSRVWASIGTYVATADVAPDGKLHWSGRREAGPIPVEHPPAGEHPGLTLLDAATSVRGRLLVGTDGGTDLVLIRESDDAERRSIHLDGRADRVVLAKPTHRQRPPDIVCAEIAGTLAWWPWEAATSH